MGDLCSHGSPFGCEICDGPDESKLTPEKQPQSWSLTRRKDLEVKIESCRRREEDIRAERSRFERELEYLTDDPDRYDPGRC